MRDILERLNIISEEEEEGELKSPGHKLDVDEDSLSQEAVIFDDSSVMDKILNEANSIRKELSLLRDEIARLCIHNERYSSSVRRLSLLKKDSDLIARAIQQQGEAVYVRIQALGKESRLLEQTEGPNSAVYRIATAQYDTLTHDFQEAMNEYTKAEEKQRSTCRARIQRQASILGKKIEDEQLDELVDKGGEGWTELSHDLQPQGGLSLRTAMRDLKGRHKELVELEARLKQIHELFMQMAILVEEQGSMINSIEANVCKAEEYVEKSNGEFKKALQYKKKNPFLQCCPCLPFWGQNKT